MPPRYVKFFPANRQVPPFNPLNGGTPVMRDCLLNNLAVTIFSPGWQRVSL
ncbi:hypothetical protein MTY_0445 [Moorella thermoacetica Y72]|uniref:Uncharacterized protein n=1 Tax=Moorella thermoacetica Y72 TaxID=1325331 RepID=A0A0S6UC24_NEOTH|nr:hypothetical protein MTY_0445 [Moorella thermoacetica Y72]